MRKMTEVGVAGRTLVLSLVLFVVGLATHEVMHLLVLYAVGGTGALVVRPWHLGLSDAATYALHAQPDHPIGLGRQLIVNFLGPTLAAVPLAVLLLYVRGVRERAVRIALAANVAILVFYALIEAGDLWLEAAVRIHAPILTAPAFNYGVPAAIIPLAGLVALPHWSGVHVGAVGIPGGSGDHRRWRRKRTGKGGGGGGGGGVGRTTRQGVGRIPGRVRRPRTACSRRSRRAGPRPPAGHGHRARDASGPARSTNRRRD